MVKDKIHSDYIKKLDGYKKTATAIQKAIIQTKKIIAEKIKNGHKSETNVYFFYLKLMRHICHNLYVDIKAIRLKIKDHQRSKIKTSTENLSFRMYSLVLRQLSPMQKGIQALHSVVEYGQMAKKWSEQSEIIANYNTWANQDKTTIILDAGVSTDLNDALHFLNKNDIPYSLFFEPDLYGCMTAISFLADERVFDTKTYPSYEDYLTNFNSIDSVTGKTPTPPTKEEWISKVFFGTDPEPILKFREFIFSKKLSN
jgi:hypothetical protein